MKLAKRMSRLGTETAFRVLTKAQALEAQIPEQGIGSFQLRMSNMGL